jgi:UDP-GlcNAc:undecaprenyl-phosphate GlcNAc-1-phosphate transferase
VTADRALTSLVAAVIGCAVTAALVRRRLTSPPVPLVRTNVAGRPVPAVLGGPLAAGALFTLLGVVGAALAGWTAARALRMSGAVALLIVVMTAAGAYDDLKGDEPVRGFAGHLGAVRRGRITGGAVKLVAGASSGGVAGVVVADGWSVLAVALTIALCANFVNLTDRAPGRAGKVSLLIAAPVVILGSSAWTVAAAGLLGGLVACLPHDLRERAMLGDAGSNPLGAVIGLGIAASLSGTDLVWAPVVLAGLNGAAERWSFSLIIARTRWLAALDRLGRLKSPT